MKFSAKVVSRIRGDQFTAISFQPITNDVVKGGKVVLDIAGERAGSYEDGKTYEFGQAEDFQESEKTDRLQPPRGLQDYDDRDGDGGDDGSF